MRGANDRARGAAFARARGAAMDGAAMDGAQRALRAHLRARLSDVKSRALDASRALDRAQREREDVGVELYALQGALARERGEWVASDAMTQRARDARERGESETEALARDARDASGAQANARERAGKRRKELEALARRAEASRDATTTNEANAAVTRRVASATANAVDNAERHRLEREVRVQYVKDCIARARESSADAKSVAADRRNDTLRMREQMATCDGALAEVNVDMDAICKRWKFALAAIGNADETLERARASEAEIAAAARLLDGERDALRDAIEDARASSEARNKTISKIDRDIDVADALIVSLKAAVEDKKLQCADVNAEARRHDADARAEDKRASEIEMDVAKVDEMYVAHTRALHDVEELALLHVAEKMTTNISAQKLARSTREFREKTKAVENENILTKNDIARAKVEIVNSLSAESQVREKMTEVEARLEERRKAIDACESEIAQNVDEIDKTTAKIDKLNKTLEKLRDISPEHVGPLEAQISHLRNEIKTRELQCSRLREQWLRAQTVILEHNERTRKAVATVSELEEVNAVLFGKRNRHERNAARNAAALEAVSKEMSRERLNLNAVDERIAHTESERRACAIKALETEDMRMREIDALSAENAKLGADIGTRTDAMHLARADSERFARSIADIQRKIELEQRAQVALDPARGNTEVAEARKENARLALALHRLHAVRDAIASKVEACVKRREMIVTKGDAIQAKISADGEEMREAEIVASAKRARSDVRRRLREARLAAEEIEPRIQALETECEDTREAQARVSTMTDALSERREFLLDDANVRLCDEYERMLLAASCHQKMAAAFEKIRARESVGADESRREKFDEVLERLKAKRDDMREALRDEIRRHPAASRALRRAQSYLSVV